YVYSRLQLPGSLRKNEVCTTGKPYKKEIEKSVLKVVRSCFIERVCPTALSLFKRVGRVPED
ncbi:hypothetical protein GIB67_009817, partial [Kingdonia uniflora]